ncbi:hypothetical protein [Nocardia takedensis]|uniref:hypothetical protein n=1 Tax=Nocardia takedensis TaxID=259390 RepID=UPI0012F6CC89|nr:hypothetical protein [Nocardia takedensis]
MSGTVIVGVAALVAATIFNVLTLKRSSASLKLAEATYQRAEERWRHDKDNEHTRSLGDAVVALSFQVSACGTHANMAAQMARALAEAIETNEPGNIRGSYRTQLTLHNLNKLQPATNDVLSAALSARLLTSDDTLQERMITVTNENFATATSISKLSKSVTPGQLRETADEIEAIRERSNQAVVDMLNHALQNFPREPSK